MKARLKMTPARMERLIQGHSVLFKVAQKGDAPAIEIEVILEEGADAHAKFDKIFTKIWNAALDKVDKAASAILK